MGGSRGRAGRVGIVGLALAAWGLIVATPGGEAHASRIVGSGTSTPGVGVDPSTGGMTPADPQALPGGELSVLPIWFVPLSPDEVKLLEAAGNGPFRFVSSGPPTTSPYLRTSPSLPVTMDLPLGPPAGVSGWNPGQPVGPSPTLSPPVAWPVSARAEPQILSTLPPSAALQSPTAAPEPSTIVLAVVLVGASLWRSRASSRRPG